MLDIKLLRNDIDAVTQQLAKRGFVLDSSAFQTLEDKRKTLQSATQELQNERNTRSKAIGKAKANGEDIQPLLAEVSDMGDKLKAAEQELADLQIEIDDILSGLPNILNESVPEGKSEDDNVEISTWGEPKSFDFEVKDHVDLGMSHGWMDFETAAKLTGSRFVVMRSGMARMHRALIQFMLDTHTADHGYQEIYVPYIVNEDS